MPRASWWMMCIAMVGGLLVAGCQGRQAAGETRQSPVSARTQLERELGLSLPDSARDVRCDAKSLFVMVMFARFDVPSNELPNVMSSGLLGKLPPLSNDPKLYRELNDHGGQPSWWKLPPEQDVQVSQSSWREARQSSQTRSSAREATVWEHTLSVCVAKVDADSSRAYLLYVVDPVGSVPQEDGR